MTGFWAKVNPPSLAAARALRASHSAPRMDRDQRLARLVEPLRSDTRSGASELTLKAAEILRSVATDAPASSREELALALAEAGRSLLEAQPAMAPLVALAREVVGAARQAASLDAARQAAGHAAHGFGSRASARAAEAARHLRTLLPSTGTVATLSFSATVASALSRWLAEGSPDASTRRVLCFESRPGWEGRELARRLAREGGAVSLAVDAAAFRLLPTCAAAVLGADSIGDAGLVNKVGSLALAQAARTGGVPVYAVADSTKVLPAGVPQPLEDDRPGDEVWPDAGSVVVWNQYFEAVPPELLAGVVTEHGILTPRELAEWRLLLDASGGPPGTGDVPGPA